MTFLLKKEISRAKTEKKKIQAKNSMSSFSTMVKFCETADKCRHAVFSEFFGDKVRLCETNCDVCSDPKGIFFLESCDEKILKLLKANFYEKPTKKPLVYMAGILNLM